MALTLVEMSKIALGRDEVYKSAIMELYAQATDLMTTIPIDDMSGNAMTFNRESILPSVGFRGVNEGYDESTGEIDQITESLVIAGGDLDVDKFLVKTGGVGQRTTQEEMKIKALSMSLSSKILKGDAATNKKEFDGLQARLVSSHDLLDAGSTSGGDVLSLLKLDELIDMVEDPTHLIMNKTMRRLLTAAGRNTSVSGFITYTTDVFGRQIAKYNDLPILIADKDSTYAEVLPFTEVGSGGGTAQCTSIYCVSFSPNGVMMLQNGGMDVTDLGELETKPLYRTRIEWYVTLAQLRKRSAARLRGIKAGAVTV